ncbi:MAG: Gfo/Idh/MocA family protein [Candidatus Scatosoma sp.]
MSEKKVRIGIFGVGHNHGAAAIKALRQRNDVEIVGLCGEDPETLKRRLEEHADVYQGIPVKTKEELFACPIEAAMVETAVPALVPTARECAERGLHVHMDKPAGTDLEEYGKLLELIEKKGLCFQTGYMYRYNAGIRYLINKIREGKLGRIYNVTAQMSTKHPVWFKKQLMSYGVKAPVMYIFGGHLLDLCLQIKGEPVSLQSFHTRSQNDGLDFEDTSLAVLGYNDGTATVRVSSSEINGWGKREFTVYGEKGTVSVSPIECPMIVRETYLENSEPWKDRYTTVQIKETGRYDTMTEEFVAQIRGDMPRETDFRHEYLLQKYTLLSCGYNVKE